jgi:hypothetical protein
MHQISVRIASFTPIWLFSVLIWTPVHTIVLKTLYTTLTWTLTYRARTIASPISPLLSPLYSNRPYTLNLPSPWTDRPTITSSPSEPQPRWTESIHVWLHLVMKMSFARTCTAKKVIRSVYTFPISSFSWKNDETKVAFLEEDVAMDFGIGDLITFCLTREGFEYFTKSSKGGRSEGEAMVVSTSWEDMIDMMNSQHLRHRDFITVKCQENYNTITR